MPSALAHTATVEGADRRQPDALRHERMPPLIKPPDLDHQDAVRRAIHRQARWFGSAEEFAPRSFGLAAQAPHTGSGRRFAARGARSATGRSVLDRRSGQQSRGSVNFCIRPILDRRSTVRCRNPPLVQGVSGPPDLPLIASASRPHALNAYRTSVSRHAAPVIRMQRIACRVIAMKTYNVQAPAIIRIERGVVNCTGTDFIRKAVLEATKTGTQR